MGENGPPGENNTRSVQSNTYAHMYVSKNIAANLALTLWPSSWTFTV